MNIDILSKFLTMWSGTSLFQISIYKNDKKKKIKNVYNEII